MANPHATLSNFRQAPRKMRMVANAVRGKKVSEVLINLDFVAKKASLPIKTLIMSALANAKALDIPTENLIVKTIKVDGGKIMYRRLPAARGSAHPIRKRTSAIFVELAEAVSKKKTKISKEVKVETVKKVKTTTKAKVKK
ncbi:MAG: 50S ribosomal protein L22 [Candidatus Zambryskibacteria bacterium RIFOXYD1_FULL_40_13]|nr:MAG: 50S ribosomal protein L22 [Parcubacteria group bacterium GW2011_GWB1_40_5]KKR82018.1 MAG: 50S ribosomal protein L22 [Parcubacteria group bacterium GW2011_GWD1_40_9]OHA87230.1 MAG: 50S ribosomal protein L22 [Candidatus Zambryskibacteria bacterium GWB1_40_5]OHB15073.1 MAG: 50S ribosomal protein L22 [Candidatus Zambryskibacteria bacterium RIFOXYD1_FULL_40_13]HBD24630.1 50S ribosomal protein L22 [Candidatus Zambryskibacteria bacterium]